jgi:hypothetical protein
MKTSLLSILLGALLVACASATVTPTQTAIPTLPSATPAGSLPTPTDIQLPFDDQNIEHEYCQLPEVQLSLTAAKALSEEQIAAKLMELLLDYFHSPQAPGYCRIGGYRIDNVYYDARTPYTTLQPRGDFLRTVQFSVKLIQIPSFWMGWAGEIDGQNWLHAGNNVAVFRSADGYTMQFAYP